MNYPIIHAIASLVLSIAATAYLVPNIIRIVRFKKLMDNPNERSSHSSATPSLGGMAFFIVLIISLYFNHTFDTYGVATSFYPALTILFFLGLKDDLVVLAPSTKVAGQTIASLFILMNPKFEINSFHGFFGINHIDHWLGIGLGLFIMLAIINAFNLIDGIDGLASSIGIVAFSGFAVVFFFAGRHFFGLTSLVMVGILTGFLFFNLSAKNKIFMGDTGSMLIGFMVGVMSIRFLSLDIASLSKLPFNAFDVPIILVSFIIIPLFDTARVFTIRVLNGKNPFSADRNHLHHILIDSFRISHRKASFCIASVNIACVLIFSVLLKLTNTYVAFTIILLFCALALLFLYRIKQVVIKRRTISRSTIKKHREKFTHQKDSNDQTRRLLASKWLFPK
ncbi:MraY family glycosyltransferase [Fluviicola chungangensis]|uniref:Undecaprenyl/decaprenyl-phosphate alpha-N-acetylglucosaminyl 1-phosphate transferase n=1 Tax=Fluviicola chungangensis TaxID=2597671 RepID=A0A556N0T9_9FLAO|nr:MraY family glycosyltransferase [Fluviicola chungangensis]TSJ45797.1 undecaprenyl/decaprenyl-phosphate alpha-N-acetylglucosaminyl 1-phosphate transferase [Fluviicola chungangensis]